MDMQDSNEPNAWDDINPPMVSAQRQGLPSPYSARLQPATSDQFRNELTGCLALVVPVGMTEEGRREWLSVAWSTLSHLPPDLLASGCKVARETCDHPSKIVPTILEATRQAMAWRREAAQETLNVPRLESPDYCTPSQAAQILKEFGLKRDPDAAAA